MGKVSEKQLILSRMVTGYLDSRDAGLFVKHYIPNVTYELFVHDIIDDMFSIGLSDRSTFTFTIDFTIDDIVFVVYYSPSGRFKHETVIVSVANDYLGNEYHIGKDNLHMDGLIEFILKQIDE